MSFLGRIFGARTRRSASSSIPALSLFSAGSLFCDTLRTGWSIDAFASAISNTNSMLPTLDANAVVVIERCPFSSLQEGDIVSYRDSSGRSLLHRLNEQASGGWRALGDGNARQDPELVTAANFTGRVVSIIFGAKSADTDR